MASRPDEKASLDEKDASFTPRNNGIDWLEYFPFVTKQTSKVAEHIVAANSDETFGGYDWQSDYAFQNLQDWFGPFDDQSIGLNPFGTDF